MGSITPAQMFDHELNPIKGWWDMHALDKRVAIGTNPVVVQRGMVGYIHPVTLDFILGVVNGYMPLFTFPGENDFDANSDVGNISGGWLNTLVATGGYELESTEFVSGPAYDPQTPLTGATAADIGKLEPASGGICGVDMIVGIVSEQGPRTNDHGKDVVRFWPVYMPQRYCEGQ
jgi:hypothetical protein